MPARQLPYFSAYSSEILLCPRCGWTGAFEEGATDYFDFLMDCSCPACPASEAPILAIVPYPTTDEWLAHKTGLTDAEQAFGDAQLAHQALFDEKKLRTASQLPDLNVEAFELLWDKEGDETVIKLGGNEVWREPAVYEGYWRYEQLLALLRKRYGQRIRDLAPTGASEYFLYGDQSSAAGIVHELRAGLR